MRVFFEITSKCIRGITTISHGEYEKYEDAEKAIYDLPIGKYQIRKIYES